MRRSLLSFAFIPVAWWPRALVATTLALSLDIVEPEGGARAATLEGLEPIEFGMTMEQARAALSGLPSRPKSDGFFDDRREAYFDEASLQIVGRFLLYKVFVESMNLHFDVRQSFREGRAAEVALRSPLLPRELERCSAEGRILARGIERNHGVSPKFRPGRLEDAFPRGGFPMRQVIESFVFVFERGASIVLMVWWMASGNCTHSIYYQPPISGPEPF